MTNDEQSPPFWPFVVVDMLFVGLAVALMEMGHHPFLWWEAAALIVCAVAGAGAFLTPFLLRSAHSQTLVQAQKLADAADVIAKHPIALQLRNLQTMSEISVEKNSTIIFPAQFMSTVKDIQKFISDESIK